MSSKKLTELEWKNFAKGKKFDDKEFTKALASLETAQHSKDIGAQLEAFDAIEKQTARLRSANKSDKELVRYVDELDKDISNERKPLEAEAKNAARKASQQAADEDEGPAALTTRMLPVLRQIPKGDDVVMQAMVATSGKLAAVLVSRRAIGPSQKKLLLEELGVSGGAKFMEGQCIWEANAHTFVLEAKVANLARLLKAALFKQTGIKFKVRVRGVDPTDVDDDGEELESAHTEAGPAPPAGEQPSEETSYESRLAALKPRIDAALHDQATEAGKIRAVAGFAETKAGEGNYKAALHALDSLAPLLAATEHKPETDAEAELGKLAAEVARIAPLIQQAAAAHPDHRQALLGAVAALQQQLASRQLPAARESLVHLAHQLLALKAPPADAAGTTRKPAKVPTQPLMPLWADASESVIDQTTEIIVRLRDYGDSELDRMADDLLETVNDLLGEVDDALEEYDDMSAEERSANAGEALDFLRSHQRDIAGDALIRAADRNPLGVKSSIGQTMERALDEIAAAFEA